MLSDVLTIGDKIDIRRLDRNGQPASNAKTYVSQFIDMIEFDTIDIATPIMNSALIVLNNSENYSLCFYTTKGLYQCSCTVLNSRKENNTVLTTVRITSNLEKVQRRQYYRLDCIIEIDYRVITDEEVLIEKKLKDDISKSKNEEVLIEKKLKDDINKSKNEEVLIEKKLKDNINKGMNEDNTEDRKKLAQLEAAWLPASIIDISGGGARFNANEKLIEGDRIQIRLNLSTGRTLNSMVLGADVISVNRIMNRYGVFETRVEFSDINKRDRENLIKYIFEQERRRRKYNPNL